MFFIIIVLIEFNRWIVLVFFCYYYYIRRKKRVRDIRCLKSSIRVEVKWVFGGCRKKIGVCRWNMI